MIVYEGTACPPEKGYIAIVVSKFNRTITQRLLDGALHQLRKHKVRDDDVRVCWVPGAFEIPLLAQRFAEQSDCCAVICLGAVIKGDTPHDEHINRAVSLEIAKIATDSSKPVVFGVLTCNTVEQAEIRSGITEQSRDKVVDPTAGNKGAEAAEVALEMLDLLSELPEQVPFPGMDMFSSLMGQMDDDDDDDDDYGSGWDYFGEDIDDDDDVPMIPPARKKKMTKKKKK